MPWARACFAARPRALVCQPTVISLALELTPRCHTTPVEEGPLTRAAIMPTPGEQADLRRIERATEANAPQKWTCNLEWCTI